MFVFNTVLENGINVAVNIHTRLCLINQLESAVGKTYLCNILSQSLQGRCYLFNYSSLDLANPVESACSIVSTLEGVRDLLILDNADLYVSKKLCNISLEKAKTVIIVGRRLVDSSFSTDCYYDVILEDRSLRLEKRWGKYC